MKKYIITLIATIIGFLGFSFAYSPTTGDQATLSALKTQINKITQDNPKTMRKLADQLQNLQVRFPTYEKLLYLLKELEIDLTNQITTQKIQVKQANKEQIKAFVANNMTGIAALPETDTCKQQYDLIDTISFANNFPTALTLATRYREASCRMYLPGNGDGPFQIVSKEYGAGDLTLTTFKQSVQDFIDFSKAKYGNYYSKIWPIFTYTGFDMTGIVNHAALYNGGKIMSGVVVPLMPKYVYEWYGNYASGAVRYGIRPKFIKLLDREVQNKY